VTKRPASAPPKSPSSWRPMTRRAFVAMFGLGAIAVTKGITRAEASHVGDSRSTRKPRTTLWIGHY